MKNKIDLIGLRGIPLIQPGDEITKIILDSLKTNNTTLEEGDIIVIAQTIISKSNGRIRDLKDIKPSKRAIEIFERISPKAEIYQVPIKSPELIQAILEESEEILKAEHILLTETKSGFVCANAGIDKSNVEGESNVTLLPENPDEDATKIRNSLKKLTNKNVAVIISDSFGRPFRIGAVGVALGVSGIDAVLDKRGSRDLYGYELQSTIIAQVDSLASAAQLIMGETDEGIPVVIIKGYEFNFNENSSIKSILRKKEIDLFRKKSFENGLDFLKNRRSYKLSFDLKNVDKKIIEKCIDVARWAPSAHNGQFWRYLILEKGKIRTELIENMNRKLRRDLTEDGKSEQFIQQKILKTKHNFLDAPFLILLCLDTKDLERYTDEERTNNEYLLGIQSISASAVYLLLALHSESLAACWYCAPLFSKEIIKKVLKLPNSYEPMAFFTVGYPIKEINPPPRKTLNEILYKLEKE
jgi:coenzyme F420-0:L-glutamate ligase/coenzyme F420-1:gamma-L-glutamate ligase